MSRSARIVLPGIPHHITQRGNQRRQMFFGDDDYLGYLQLLQEYSTRYAVDISGYCLMPNHTHLLLIPPTNEALSRVMGLLSQRYSQWRNFVDRTTGHRWQNRYFSCPLAESHSYHALRYIGANRGQPL